MAPALEKRWAHRGSSDHWSKYHNVKRCISFPPLTQLIIWFHNREWCLHRILLFLLGWWLYSVAHESSANPSFRSNPGVETFSSLQAVCQPPICSKSEIDRLTSNTLRSFCFAKGKQMNNPTGFHYRRDVASNGFFSDLAWLRRYDWIYESGRRQDKRGEQTNAVIVLRSLRRIDRGKNYLSILPSCSSNPQQIFPHRMILIESICFYFNFFLISNQSSPPHHDDRWSSSSRIHPYAYAVKTFLQPALEQCIRMVSTSPQETFQLLLSLIKTFLRFTPEPELVFDEIQQFAGMRRVDLPSQRVSSWSLRFAVQLNDTLNQCFASLDRKTSEDLSSTLESLRKSLREIIDQTGETFRSMVFLEDAHHLVQFRWRRKCHSNRHVQTRSRWETIVRLRASDPQSLLFRDLKQSGEGPNEN